MNYFTILCIILYTCNKKVIKCVMKEKVKLEILFSKYCFKNIVLWLKLH